MRKWVLASMVLVTVLVAGCGSATKASKQAEKVAIEFYRGWFLDGDVGWAWDLSAPGLWTTTNREEFIADQRKLRADTVKLLPADTELRVQAFDRAGDYLFLVSDKRKQHLIWVTKTDDGAWKVRRILDYREGMDIPW